MLFGNDEDQHQQDAPANRTQPINEENIVDELLFEVCPFLFSNASGKPSVNQKFAKVYNHLRKYVEKKLDQDSDYDHVRKNVSYMIDDLMWKNPEIVDLFNAHSEWLKDNTIQSRGASIVDGLTSSITNNLLRSSMVGGLGDLPIALYEFRHALRTALYQLQLKEREYRRIPKELLEMVIDKFLPNAQSGRSLVQFIITELQRLKRETEDITAQLAKSEGAAESDNLPTTSVAKRAIRVVALTFMKLLERRLIPIPGVQMLDDNTKTLVLQQKQKKKKFKGIIPFSKHVYLEYLYSKTQPTVKKELGFSVSYSSGSSNDWNSSYSNRVISGGSRMSSNVSRELETWKNQYRDIIGPVSINVPLYRYPRKKLEEMTISLKKKEKELEKRLKVLERLESYWESHTNGSEPQKYVISQYVTKCLEKKLDYFKWKKRQQFASKIIISPHVYNNPNDISNEYIPQHKLATEYKSMLNDRVKRYLKNMELDQIVKKEKEISEMLGENLKTCYPQFLQQICTITKNDMEEFYNENSILTQQKEQIQSRSLQFLHSLKTEIGEISVDKFCKLISSEGPLHNVVIVQNLLKKAHDYIEQNSKFRDIVPYLSKQDKDLEATHLLYQWTFEGHDDEYLIQRKEAPTSTRLKQLTKQISNFVLLSKLPEGEEQQLYVPYNAEDRLEIVRDFCVTNILKAEENNQSIKESPCDGERFILNFLTTLWQTIEYESYYPEAISKDNYTVDSHQLSVVQQKEKDRMEVIKKAALHHILNSICKNDEERSWFSQRWSKYFQSSSKAYVEQSKDFFTRLEGKKLSVSTLNFRPVTQEEEQQILMNQLDFETHGRTMDHVPRYDHAITMQRRKQFFD